MTKPSAAAPETLPALPRKAAEPRAHGTTPAGRSAASTHLTRTHSPALPILHRPGLQARLLYKASHAHESGEPAPGRATGEQPPDRKPQDLEQIE